MIAQIILAILLWGVSANWTPEWPGKPAADAMPCQIWWVLTIAAAGAARWLLATRRESWAGRAALAMLPHVVNAPQPPNHALIVPSPLAAQFAGLVLATNAMMRLINGTLLGRFRPQQEEEKPA